MFPETNLFVIEAYTFPLPPDEVPFHELCGLMAARGFRAIDLSEPLWRSKDGALWQFDLFFVPRHPPRVRLHPVQVDVPADGKTVLDCWGQASRR